jgi:hypothetical protein
MATLITLALVLGSDGKVDKSATLASCDSAIDKYVAQRETEQATIAECVGAIFDQYKGATLNMPFVQNEACRRLNASPANFKVLQDLAADYVRENSQGAKVGEGDSATVEHPESLFLITKGKGGGVSRRADLPAKPAASAK